MWLYVSICQGFLLITYVLSMLHLKHDADIATSGNESVFTDVIKNISKVNNVLKELIKNYEQLQNIYKTKSFETDYSTDSEVDEPFKSKSSFQKARDKSVATRAPNRFPATQMLTSGEDKIEKDSDKSSEESSDSQQDLESNKDINKNKVPKIESLQAKEIDKIISDDTSITSDESFSSELEHESKKEDVTKSGEKPKKPKIVFADTHEIVKNNIKNENTQDNEYHTNTKVKSRYKTVPERNDDGVIKGINIEKQLMPNTVKDKKMTNRSKKIKKIVFAETFERGKIWDEIINNKPIDLKPHAPNRNLRSRPKSALVIVTNNKRNRENEWDNESDSEEDDKEIDKEVFKTSILRKAYGDACLKVVVKKCYKACKQVIKEVCNRHKCKGDFKGKFEEHSKTGCVREFRQLPFNKTFLKEGFVDATRDGISACYPSILPAFLRNDSNLIPSEKKVNILRDRYERACAKESRMKCQVACDYAYQKTCSIYTCDKSKRKSFKRACRKRCKIQYQVISKSSKKSSGSSESSDGSDDSDSSVSV